MNSMAETIGQQLKQARQAKKLGLEAVSQITQIRQRAIQALEADDFDSFPSATQARGFLKVYADLLGLSLEDLFARQKADQITTLPIDEQASATVDVKPIPEATEEHIPHAPPTSGRKRTRRKTPPPQAEMQPLSVEPAEITTDETSPARGAVMEGTPSAAQAIFSEIGETLRQRRESLSLNYEEIERHTHIRKGFLEILENGQFDQLASSVQARGLLNNYITFLDLDLDALLLKFATGVQTLHAERHLVPDAPPHKEGSLRRLNFIPPGALRRLLSPDLLVGGGMLFLLLIFAIWGTNSIIQANRAETPQPTAPSISNILLATLPENTPGFSTALPPEATLITPGSEATLGVALPPAGEGPVQIVLVATRSVWVKVLVDFKVVLSERISPGTAYSFDADSQIEVVTGDGSAISILYNQTNLGTMGGFGEIVDRIYTATTILQPTMTFTPTATITPTATKTLRPSATLRPSSTPRPTLVP